MVSTKRYMGLLHVGDREPTKKRRKKKRKTFQRGKLGRKNIDWINVFFFCTHVGIEDGQDNQKSWHQELLRRRKKLTDSVYSCDKEVSKNASCKEKKKTLLRISSSLLALFQLFFSIFLEIMHLRNAHPRCLTES